MKSIAETADVKPVLSRLLLIKDHVLDRGGMRWAGPTVRAPGVPGPVSVGVHRTEL